MTDRSPPRLPPRLPLDRRALLRGALAVTAATAMPLRRGHAGEILSNTGETVVLGESDIKDLQLPGAAPGIFKTVIPHSCHGTTRLVCHFICRQDAMSSPNSRLKLYVLRH